jgi:hypothetical protein
VQPILLTARKSWKKRRQERELYPTFSSSISLKLLKERRRMKMSKIRMGTERRTVGFYSTAAPQLYHIPLSLVFLPVPVKSKSSFSRESMKAEGSDLMFTSSWKEERYATES